MTLSTSVVAACCYRASFSSRAIRASFLFSETKMPLRERRDSNRLGRCALVRSSPKHDELWSNAGQIGILLLAGMVPLPRLAAISTVCCGFALVVPNFFQGVCELVHTCAPSGATNSKKGRCQDTTEHRPYDLRTCIGDEMVSKLLTGPDC